MRLQMAHIRRPQCCLSGFCSVSRVTMVLVYTVMHAQINYISVLSYAAEEMCYCAQHLTRCLCESLCGTPSSHIFREIHFSGRNGAHLTGLLLFTRVARLSRDSRIGQRIAGIGGIVSTDARNDYSRSIPRNDERCSCVYRFLQVNDSYRLSVERDETGPPSRS